MCVVDISFSGGCGNENQSDGGGNNEKNAKI